MFITLVLEALIVKHWPNVVDEAHAADYYLLGQREVNRLVGTSLISACSKLVERVKLIVSTEFAEVDFI